MTNMMTHAAAQLAASMVIFSEREAVQSGAGFWSNDQGWTTLGGATLFTHQESQSYRLPFRAQGDVAWMHGTDAARASLAAQIKKTLIEDGFDVAQAPDGRWYFADEQDRDEVTAGEHHTEAMAWRDLAETRRHVLAEAGLEPAGAFSTFASSARLAQQYNHGSTDAVTVVHMAARDHGEYELRVRGTGARAYFEWVDHIGDPVGDVFTTVDFAAIEATLSPGERDTAAPTAG
jgi:hypothetical protein